MYRFLIMTLAALLLSHGMALAAEDSKPAQTQPAVARIGVVDMQRIATESDPAKDAQAEMESKYGKERSALEKKGQNLKKQAEGLKNPKVSEQKKVDFIKAKQKLDNDTRNFLRKVEQDEIKIRQEMVTRIFNAAYEVAKAKGYNFVVDVNAGGVIYADRSMDLTQAVLAQVNKMYQENKKSDAEKSGDDKKTDDADKKASDAKK